MVCEKVRMPDGGIAIMCSRNKRKPAPTCQYCHCVGEKLCDGPHPKRDTCDKRMCSYCAYHVDPDLDFCPDHIPELQMEYLARKKIQGAYKRGTITVGNKKRGDEGIYVGRPSVLGNPFKLDPTKSREDQYQILEHYRQWLWQHIQAKDDVCKFLIGLRERVLRGESIKLVCWCAPEPCHADIIKKALEWMIQKSA